MLDITRSAHTVGITTVSVPIGRSEAFSISNWLFFLQLKLELSVCSVRVWYACVPGRRLRHVDVDTFSGYECFIGFLSLFPFVFQFGNWICGGIFSSAQS